ncbi:UvrD-helicase domain-containing protein [Eubacteriales bacterium OttesenSCG-928-A19]|nr:UvrD-helicase domain-containing protein [Eubacteriales bacterium OttesenSCG-928-A19]
MPEWTGAQAEAIRARGSNLLVTASAGSGKTAVLTERIVSLVKEGERIDGMLVVTFTKAAAAEMRARILTALHEAASEGDPHLAAQAMRVEHADISTLHAFCTRVCREYFQAAGVDPTFRVADAAEARVLQAQALEEGLLACFEAADSPAFAYAAECFSQDELALMVESLHRFLMARPNPWEWLDEAVAAQQVSTDALRDSPWMEALLSRVKLEAYRVQEAYDQLIAFTEEIGEFQAFARAEAEQAAALLEAARVGYDALMALPKPTFARRPSKRGMDKALSQAFGTCRDAAKNALKGVHQLVDSLSALEDMAEDASEMGLALSGIARAARAFDEAYTQLKMERNLLDFADLEHCALRALRDDGISAAMRARYAHVFVDEYQDSSLLQEALLARVRGERNLFMVGDVKQSIYRFRLAEPALFLEKQQTFGMAHDAGNRRIALNANFRSHPLLLEGINDAFQSIFTGEEMELDYSPEEHLTPGKDGTWAGAPIELHVMVDEETQLPESAIEADDGADSTGELSPEERAAIRQEAEIIADRIQELQHAPEGGYHLRDMAVLMRTVRGKAAQVVEVLRARGIPAWSDLGEDALDRCEVQAILSILQVIDNLYQDIPLMAALRGPALGISDDDLATIRAAKPEGTMADAMLFYAQERADPLSEALRAFVERIRGWALDAQVLPLDCLLRRIYDETGHYAQSGARPDGQLRQANLRMMAEHAGTYQRTQAGGLGGFLRYLERVKAHEGIAAQEIGEGDDVVRVLSIHKSKGLQYPIVFVAGLGRHFGGTANASQLRLHAELGLGIEYRRPDLRTRRPTLPMLAIEEKHRREDIAEEARILYVAMTRAEQRLILLGTPRRGEIERWEKAKDMPAALGKSMLAWVLPVAGRGGAWSLAWHRRTRMPAKVTAQASLRRIEEEVRIEHDLPDETGIARALAFSPEQPARAQPIKQSVSAVVRAAAKRGEEESTMLTLDALPVRPLFMEEKGLTASEKGSAIHAFLSAVPLDAQDLEGVRRSMVTRGMLSEEQAASLPMRKIARIIASPLWQRMRAAERIHREWPFNLRMKENGQRTLLQGIIDCCFLEDGQWILVDYKSDRVEDLGSILARYKPQLEHYAMALERITQIPVASSILFLIDNGKGYEMRNSTTT